MAARGIAGTLTPVFLLVAVAGLGRANYMAWVLRRGSTWSRGLVALATMAAVALWVPRL